MSPAAAAPVRKKSEQRRRQRLVAVRFTEDEWTAVRAGAQHEGCSLPEYLRRLGVAERVAQILRDEGHEHVAVNYSAPACEGHGAAGVAGEETAPRRGSAPAAPSRPRVGRAVPPAPVRRVHHP